MKRILALSIVSLLFVLFIGCESEVTLTAPENLTVTAATNEVDVVLDWDEVIEEIDGYIVYFNGTAIDTVATAGYTHTDPQETGSYYVTAYIGEDESDPSTSVSTAPVVADNITLAEINASGNSGLGWDRTSGSATSYSMADATNAAFIDFYFSDWAAGYGGSSYSFISPDLVETDPGVTWNMSGSWNSSSFTNALTESFDNVTVLPASGYYNTSEITATNAAYGVYTNDGYYGLVEVKSINTNTGEVEIRVAFQPVQGLRILEH
ncbi:MAG TPA: hypothetical protein ENI34_07350 [candidate division WOR-3 bacterium]|uniref:Uncharacterized protein n=1 Tax=candidate division WOR-3 bacterium TaxID=2052148 RepID=A0A9C9K0C8_UNCW3|nr:hypothetical protein [candidate division WOR-3 bacterium]